MLELFLSPWAMVAGGALVSSPIIIHLINRMRFKRIRWAAMEFLLKSQKRNRRRLIIEQILLLLLRILLVLLTAILVARFVGWAFGFGPNQSTFHLVLLDDTPSMTDQWREEGVPRDTFSLAKELITERICKNALNANTPQTVQLIRLSNLDDESIRVERLNTETLEELRGILGGLQATAVRVDLVRGVEKAEALLNARPTDRRLLHIVSDFRQRDWSGPEADQLTARLQALARADVKIRLVDAAHPFRSEIQRVVLHHDNLGITDLRPETRVAARHMPVQFHCTVHNFSASERKFVRVTVNLNGIDRPDASFTLLSVPPGATSATFTLSFDQLGFNQVTANLEPEEAGLPVDNVRYAVVEVRERVPVLVIDGDLATSSKPGGDTFHMQTLFDNVRGAAKGYELISRGVGELEQPNLDQYPSIYLLNVRELTEKALANLENYVREGGGLAVFLGERTNADWYNRHFYADGRGLFPAPLAGRPEPPLGEEELTPDFFLDQYQLFVRNPQHPIFAEVWDPKIRGLFKFLAIKRYFPVARAKWRPEPGKVEELATLPNRRSVDDYKDAVQGLLGKLPIDDPRYAKFAPSLERHRRAIRELLAGKPLYQLANALDLLLRDTGNPENPEQPNLRELWEQPEMRGLHDEIDKLREIVQYGDPLVVASRFGKGRVVAFMTTAGQRWNNWAGGFPVSATWTVVMIETQKYLTGLSGDENRLVGSAKDFTVDAARYDSRIRRFFWPEPKDGGQAGGPRGDAAKVANLVDKGEQVGSVRDQRLTFVFDEARQPGVYLFRFYLRPEAAAEPTPEDRAVAFNIDTAAEGDL
ncbi:MAG: BatA domain-containing protein, partial [Gemmataceae bacterium]|nr:BatA domain-containing protein [Gemmataceae bacterium]MDW8264591.1 BatA domain-containing protein [Gemmataceae bacterium]